MSIKVAVVTEFCESCGAKFRKAADKATVLCEAHRMDGETGMPEWCGQPDETTTCWPICDRHLL